MSSPEIGARCALRKLTYMVSDGRSMTGVDWIPMPFSEAPVQAPLSSHDVRVIRSGVMPDISAGWGSYGPRITGPHTGASESASKAYILLVAVAMMTRSRCRPSDTGTCDTNNG